MKNLVSYNELATWEVKDTPRLEDINDRVADYFSCIAEVGVNDGDAKRFCRHILTE
jgi:hypothetical protein